MFLHLLDDRQQRALLALARQFIEADGRLAAEERNLLELMYAEAGQPFDAELPAGPPEALADAFDTRQARAAALLELIGVAAADSELHAAESDFLRRLAERFDIPPATLSRMQDWVSRQIALAQEAEQFWSA